LKKALSPLYFVGEEGDQNLSSVGFKKKRRKALLERDKVSRPTTEGRDEASTAEWALELALSFRSPGRALPSDFGIKDRRKETYGRVLAREIRKKTRKERERGEETRA